MVKLTKLSAEKLDSARTMLKTPHWNVMASSEETPSVVRAGIARKSMLKETQEMRIVRYVGTYACSWLVG